MLRMLAAAVLAATVATVTPGAAMAQAAFPSKEVRFICGFPAGSGADIIVRFFADKIAKKTGHTFIVENRPGAGGMLALTHTARAQPDGHTILLAGGNAVAINANLLKNPPIDAAKDIKVAATINKMPFLLVVDGKSSYNSLGDLTEAMRIKGRKASYAYSSPFSKVIAESYKTVGKLDAAEVAYKSATDSLNDLSSGAVDFAILDPVMGLSLHKEGKVRALAISTADRTNATGTLPTFTEQGVKLDLPGWWAALVPAGTPAAVVETINGWFAEALKEPDTREFLAKGGADPLTLSAADANKYFLEEISNWDRLIKMARIEKQ